MLNPADGLFLFTGRQIRTDGIDNHLSFCHNKSIFKTLSSVLFPKEGHKNDRKCTGYSEKGDFTERRGRAFYQKVAEDAENRAVRDFFKMMVTEEEHHMKILGEQFKAFKTAGNFQQRPYDAGTTSDMVSKILSKDILDKVESAGFESAAIFRSHSPGRKGRAGLPGSVKNRIRSEEKKLYECWPSGSRSIWPFGENGPDVDRNHME